MEIDIGISMKMRQQMEMWCSFGVELSKNGKCVPIDVFEKT